MCTVIVRGGGGGRSVRVLFCVLFLLCCVLVCMYVTFYALVLTSLLTSWLLIQCVNNQIAILHYYYYVIIIVESASLELLLNHNFVQAAEKGNKQNSTHTLQFHHFTHCKASDSTTVADRTGSFNYWHLWRIT